MKSALLLLGLCCALVLAGPAVAAQPLPSLTPTPSAVGHVATPVPKTGVVIVVDVTPFRVTLWGTCPIPCDTFFVVLGPKSEGALGKVTVVRFPFLAHDGYYSIGNLTPGTDYVLRVYGLVGRTQLLVGSVRFQTPDLGAKVLPIPPRPPTP